MFKVIPLDVISAPNHFTPLPNNRWEVINPNAQTLWFQLQIVDSLGARRYMPAAGSTLQVVFQRSDLIANDNLNRLTNTSRNVTKTATANADDRSLYSIAMTTQDIQNIVSGSTKYTLTEGATTTTWVFDWSIMKTLTDPGF